MYGKIPDVVGEAGSETLGVKASRKATDTAEQLPHRVRPYGAHRASHYHPVRRPHAVQEQAR